MINLKDKTPEEWRHKIEDAQEDIATWVVEYPPFKHAVNDIQRVLDYAIHCTDAIEGYDLDRQYYLETIARLKAELEAKEAEIAELKVYLDVIAHQTTSCPAAQNDEVSFYRTQLYECVKSATLALEEAPDE